MAKQSSYIGLLIERILPWFVLAVLAWLTYAYFFQVPYAGFEFSRGWVGEIYISAVQGNSIQVGDRLIQVGQVPWENFEADLRQTLFDGASAGQVVPLLIERGDQMHSINWVYPGFNRNQALQRLNGQWWMAYVFWLAGTATLLLIRPKDTRWRLLIAFNYLTAIWLAAGSGLSHWHIGVSAIVLRAAIWLCLPVYLHFHWFFPRSLGRLPAFALGGLYLAGGTLAAFEWFQVIPMTAYYYGFIIALVGSLVLLVAHLIFQPAYRRDIGLLAMAAMLVLLPPIVISSSNLVSTQLSFFIQGGAFLAMPALPGAYFFVSYRRQFSKLEHRSKRLITLYLSTIILGTGFILLLSLLDARFGLGGSTFLIGIAAIILTAIIAIVGFAPFLALPALAGDTYHTTRQPVELVFRANRLLSLYLFFILVGAALAFGIVLANARLDFPGAAILIGVVAALLAGIITAVGFTPFQRFVERQLLGIPLPPTHLVETYAARITTSLDKSSLVHLLKDEILPSLLVRQSALLRCEDDNHITSLYSVGIDADQLPTEADIPALLDQAGKYRLPSDETPEPYPWVRLILPLNVGGKPIGFWLLGRRDPDDYYARAEIPVLQSIANQTAIALTNITQAERLRMLYHVNIERHENERANLARDLHDEVLNQLAVLSMNVNQRAAPNFQENYQAITTRLRQMVSGLRPAMLDYGLHAVLEELLDGLTERAGDNVAIQLDLPPTEVRYDPRIEGHLYRIVQQASENALRHAHARTIRIHGQLEPDRVNLVVEDDGTGFPARKRLDLTSLLADRHFGLVGMHERAALIGAEVQIDSVPKRGTRVSVSWSAEERRS